MMKKQPEIRFYKDHRSANRYFWLFLLFMVLFASTLIFYIFQLSWLALLGYVFLQGRFRSAFQFSYKLENQHIYFQKWVGPWPYWQSKFRFEDLVFDEQHGQLLFRNQQGQAMRVGFELIDSQGGLRVEMPEATYCLGWQEEARRALLELSKDLKAEEIDFFWLKSS